jgi:Holliday junction resolvase RusA-like endonuclease
MMQYYCTVPGLPAPKGSRKSFVNPRTGRIVSLDACERTKPYQEAVALAVREAMQGAPPLEGPISLTVTFLLPLPKRASRKLPCVRPDVDKLLRSVLDGMTSGGAYQDDGQVTDVSVEKRYASVPMTCLSWTVIS